ncbi:hydantoin racemase [Apiospora saccharicola]|uniref:Hydantoin racemase n=1 Tax=Apiospora saccharicola TaxID=335842 RepID=A0ABR1V8G4_9PEZI
MSFKLVRPKPTRILVLNPNSSQSMTDGLEPIINSVDLGPSAEVHTFTAPKSSPASINDDEDIEASYNVAWTNFMNHDPEQWDCVLVACFSVHPLVKTIGSAYPEAAVTGIFEASVLAATSLTGRTGDKWGIITTGKFWEEHLTRGVAEYLGGKGAPNLGPNSPFAGVESTGLNASDFHHGVDPAVVTQKIREATLRLLEKGVGCIVMGCAGMAGLEETIRSAACEEKGERWAYETLHVVDGVRAGLVQVDQMIKDYKLRPRQGR